jgi:hypothetical protein
MGGTIVFVLPFLLMSALVTITGVAALLNHHLPKYPAITAFSFPGNFFRILLFLS